MAVDSKVRKVKCEMEEEGLDILILLKQANIFYISGVYFKHRGTSAVVIPQDGEPCVLTKEHEFFRAQDESKINSVRAFRRDESLLSSLIRVMKSFTKTDNIGVEEEYITHLYYHSLEKGFPSSKISPASHILDDLRVIKSGEELDLLEKSCQLADLAVKTAIETAREGVSELEIAAKAEAAMRSEGASDRSFRSIISSGVRTSYTHGWATGKSLSAGDLVMFDMGAVYNNYYSDMTRMGKVGKITKEKRDIVETTVETYQTLLDLLKPGVKVCDVVSETLKPIVKRRYDRYLVHGMGRGIGLELFERPFLKPENEEILRRGMVIAISPALFVKGKYGARVEGVVLVRDKGNEPLTKLSPALKDLR